MAKAKKKKTLEQIETIYVHGRKSYRALAEEYGVPFKTLSYYAKRNKWPEKRRQFRDKVRTKADAKESNRQANRLIGIGESAEKVVDIIQNALEDPMQFRRRVYIDDDGVHEEEVQTVNVSAIKQVVGALKGLADVIRDVYNLPKAEAKKENVEIRVVMPEGMEFFDD